MLKTLKEKLFGVSTKNVPVSGTSSIVMYSTRFCPYCVRARGLLQSKGWAYEEIAVDMDPVRRGEMTDRSGRHTVPQIWIGETHVGGCDELFRLEVSGQLESLVTGASNE